MAPDSSDQTRAPARLADHTVDQLTSIPGVRPEASSHAGPAGSCPVFLLVAGLMLQPFRAYQPIYWN